MGGFLSSVEHLSVLRAIFVGGGVGLIPFYFTYIYRKKLSRLITTTSLSCYFRPNRGAFHTRYSLATFI